MAASVTSKTRKTQAISPGASFSRSTCIVFGADEPNSRAIRLSFAVDEKEKGKSHPLRPLVVHVDKQQVEEFMKSLSQMFEAVQAAAELRLPLTEEDLCDDEDAALFNAVGKGRAIQRKAKAA